MPWKVNLGDKSVLLDDLSPSTFQAVANQHGLSWFELYSSPAADIDAYYDLLCAAADHAGAEPPEKPETMRAARDMLDMIENVEENDRPKAGTHTETSTQSSAEEDPATN